MSIQGKLVLTVFFLGVVYSGSALAANQVGLDVDSNGDLVVVSNQLRCAGGPIGCIEVAQNSSPHIYFNLPKACRNNGPDYRLVSIRIRDKDRRTDNTKAWPSAADQLKPLAEDDFCADPVTGEVDLNSTICNNSVKDDKLKMKDFNSAANSVWYEITAENCTNPDDKITLDPQIKNRGTQDV